MAHVVSRLSEALAEWQFTPSDLADHTGVPLRTIRRMSCRRSNPFLDQALVVAAQLGASVTDLFWLEEGGVGDE
jgi:DNA-binding XRE family transcriptional regulator